MARYRPRTASPFGPLCAEVAPCEALRPYVCCFWEARSTGEGPLLVRDGLVTPDTCMDIIVRERRGRVDSRFCGINDAPFTSVSEPGTTLFGIRFYFWSAGRFAEDSLAGTCNAFEDAHRLYGGVCREVEAAVSRETALSGRVREAERILLRRLEAQRRGECVPVLRATAELLRRGGTATVQSLAQAATVGPRQLERLVAEYVGVSPKKLARMVRYQCVWQELLGGGADVQELVSRYGFTDQPHLLREFRRFHTVTPREALRMAHADR